MFSDTSLLSAKGPLLLACNHPNSFLDAIIVGSHFKQPVHFLSRGDAFRKPFARKLLSALQMIPIYRLSEGREHLALNDETFERCRKILSAGGIVLIFAEGLCLNQWILRPLKKGAARIALDGWDNPAIAEQFRTLPVSLNYNSFRNFGKRLIIHFGEPLGRKEIAEDLSGGEAIHYFNRLLAERLESGMLQSYGDEKIVQLLISNHFTAASPYLIADLKTKRASAEHDHLQDDLFKLKEPYLVAASKISLITHFLIVLLFLIPAMIGLIVNLPLYYPIKKLVGEKTKGTVFYDSVLFGSLLLTYPVYWIVINVGSLFVFHNICIKCILILTPLFAWTYLFWKDSLQRVINYFCLTTTGKKRIASLLS